MGKQPSFYVLGELRRLPHYDLTKAVFEFLTSIREYVDVDFILPDYLGIFGKDPENMSAIDEEDGLS